MPDVDRGRLIVSFRLPFDRSTWGSLGVASAAVAVFEISRRFSRPHESLMDWVWPLCVVALPLITLFRRTVKFHENGVALPPDENRKAKARFLRWEQIARYHFDGAMLDLEGATDTLKGGPVPGATMKVPTQHQALVMSILAAHVR